ncbi:cupin domain-containing protein [Chromobacterium vaccinii]|uniref:cupin domain-containing protein n=1 Tax=Chromobacterium vaccinii TaxID=1108595 RepID=UPI0031D3D4B6
MTISRRDIDEHPKIIAIRAGLIEHQTEPADMSTPAPILTASTDWHWSPTPYPGVDFTWLRRNPDGGGSALLKLAKGAKLPLHQHPGTEQVFVTAGRLKVGEHVLNKGDHLFIDAHVPHAVEALQSAVYLTLSESDGVELLEPDQAR